MWWNEANEKPLQKIGFLSPHEGRVPFSLSGKLPLCNEETLVSPVGAAVSDAGWLLYFLAKLTLVILVSKVRRL